MGKVTILPETTKNPITLMGARAGVCWGTDTTDAEKNYKRGRQILADQHGRVHEFVNVEMVLDGWSARVIREWYTHIGGAPTRLQASTRYIDYTTNFEYTEPHSIACNSSAHLAYQKAMTDILFGLRALEDLGVPREDQAMLLPLGMTTKVVDKRNLRNLIEMSHQRLCGRAYWEYRALMNAVMNALSAYSPEWRIIVGEYMKPKCEVLGYCPEKKSCGRYGNKEKK